MNCQEMRERISTRLDGELNDEETKLLEEHLRVCPSCQNFEKSLMELSGKMKLWDDVKIPADLQSKLLTTILKKEKQKVKVFGISFGCYRIPAPLAWAAVFLLAFLSFHLVKGTFFKKEMTYSGAEYEVALRQKEETVPTKIFITSGDIVTITTNYKSISP